MTASSPLVQHVFDVGHRSVLVTLGRPDSATKICPAVVEWSPDAPTSRLPPDEQLQFEAGRHAALAQLAAVLGGGVTLITADPPAAPDGH